MCRVLRARKLWVARGLLRALLVPRALGNTCVYLNALILAVGCHGAAPPGPPPRGEGSSGGVAANTPREPPDRRLDLVVALGGWEPLGIETSGAGGLMGAARVAFAGGFGFTLGGGYVGDLSLESGGTSEPAQAPFMSGGHVEAAALYRLRLVGDDRRGVGVDVFLGASWADLVWNPGHGACTSTGTTDVVVRLPTCTSEPYRPPPQTFGGGVRGGPLVGASIDGRVGGFVGGIDLRYRMLFGPERIPDDPVALHVISLGFHLGFGVAQ